MGVSVSYSDGSQRQINKTTGASMWRRRVARPLSAHAIGFLPFIGNLIAQEPITIESDPQCQTCQIMLDTVLTLGGPSDTVLLAYNSKVAIDSRGRLYVAPLYSEGQIAVYAPDGHLLQLAGRKGQGPGEFDGISQIAAVHDTIHVFEGPRHSVMEPDLSYAVRIHVLPLFPQFVAYVEGSLFVTSVTQLAPHLRGPVYQIDSNEVVASFGGDLSPIVHPTQRLHLVTGTKHGRVITAPIYQYRWEYWNEEGQVARAFLRDAEWFRPWTDWNTPNPRAVRPKPVLTAMWEDQAGRLWTVVTVADEEWSATEHVRRGEQQAIAGGSEDYDYDRVFDSIIEIIDPDARRVIARTRLDVTIHGVTNQNVLYGKTQHDDGHIIIRLWRARLSNTGIRNNSK